ncbi:MAG: FAD-dependent oxidoreductase [Patescibacteria group bacterium]
MNYPSYWFEAIPDKLHFPKLTGDKTVDVVVVGGGMSGILTAYLLTKQGKTVVVLEQNHIGTGDTGFTTAFLNRIPDTDIVKLTTKYGINRVRDIYETYSAAQKLLFKLIQAEQIDCDFMSAPSRHYSNIPNSAALLAEWNIVKQLDHQAEWKDNNIQFNQEGSWHIRKFIFALAKKLQIYEQTVVTGIKVNKKNVLVNTSEGEVTAQKVIVTTGLPATLTEWHHLFETRLSYVIALQYDKPVTLADGQFWDSAEPYHYYRKVNERTIILGGADRYGWQPQPAQTPYQQLEDWAKQNLSGNFTVTHRWSGSLFETSDGLPYITPHPYYPKQVWLACGFSGNGMVGSAVAAQLISQEIVSKNFTLQRTKQTLARLTTSNPMTQGWWKWPTRLLLFLIYGVALITPAVIFYQDRGGFGWQINIFPLVGLYAFTLVWAQIVLGAGMWVWRRVFTWIEPYHRAEGVVALLFALLHPILILYSYGLSSYLDRIPFLYLGYFQLILLCSTVGTAILMKWKRLKHIWLYIHLANYVVFTSVWIHSWFIGSDVRFSNLKYLWMFYAITALGAVGLRLYNYFKPVSARVKTSGWVQAAKISAVLMGQPYLARVGQLQVAIFNIKGQYYAIDNVCSHAGGPLCQGSLNGTTIQCPWHESKFDVVTGHVVTGPARRDQRRFATKVVGDSIYIKS